MRARRLKQVDAAAMFGIRQPDVSKMLRGEFRQFSVERLMRFLVALGQDCCAAARWQGQCAGSASGLAKVPDLKSNNLQPWNHLKVAKVAGSYRIVEVGCCDPNQ